MHIVGDHTDIAVMSSYKTIAKEVNSIVKVKGSKFIANAFPFTSEKKLKELLQGCKEKYPKASHYCYAYRTGNEGNIFRTNDDGEPGGSAGAPILNQIDSFELTNILIVIVRYFGGTKLGIAGLIKAYKSAAKSVLEIADIVEKEEKISIEIDCTYNDVHEIIKALTRSGIEIFHKEFGKKCILIISLNEADAQKFKQLTGKLHSISFNIRKLDI